MTSNTDESVLQANLLEAFRTKGLDWCLREMKKSIPPETCLCGRPLFEKCHYSCDIKINEYRGGVMPSFVDDSASDIRLQSDASLSKRSIHYAYAMDWITGWEDSFCIDVGSKESEDGFKLTEKQLAKRILINAKFLAAFDQCAANLAL